MFLLIASEEYVTQIAASFNTSHVSINPTSPAYSNASLARFNTSHVSINLKFGN